MKSLINPTNWSSRAEYILGMTLLLVLVGMFVIVVV